MWEKKDEIIDKSKIEINLWIVKFHVNATRPLDWIWKHLRNLPHIFKLKQIYLFILILFLILALWITYFLKKIQEPKIYDVANGYKLLFQDDFEWWNMYEWNNHKWIIKDNKFINWDNNSLTLKSAWLNERGYPIYQNLKYINADHILVSKFYLPEWSRIWLQFANTTSFESDEILDLHYQECRISSFAWTRNNIDYYKWYWGYLYKRWWEDDDYEKIDVLPWNYYMLAKISWNSISCYIQKEWEDSYKTIVNNERLEFQNLGWPVITKFVDNKNNYPELLEFRLYVK